MRRGTGRRKGNFNGDLNVRKGTDFWDKITSYLPGRGKWESRCKFCQGTGRVWSVIGKKYEQCEGCKE